MSNSPENCINLSQIKEALDTSQTAQTQENQVTPQDVPENNGSRQIESDDLSKIWEDLTTQPPAIMPVDFEMPELVEFEPEIKEFVPGMHLVGDYPDDAETLKPGPVLAPEDLNGEGVTPAPKTTESVRDTTKAEFDDIFADLENEF